MLETGQFPPTTDPAGRHAASFGQERFYFLQQQDPTSTILNRVLRFRLTGRIDAAALEASLRAAITRHVPLRTALLLDGSGLTPKLLNPTHFALREATATPEVPADVLVRSHAEHSFRLDHDFPLRALLVHESDTLKQLLICIHHTAADGSSDRILLQELSRLYNSAVSGPPITLPELAYSYTDFAAEQRSARTQARAAKHLDYWRRQLASLERSEIIAERSPESAQAGKAAECSTLIPADVFLGLQELARSERATPFMVIVAITQMLIGRLSGESDVAIGSTVANRTRPQHEALVGCFMNTVVLRAQLDDDEAFRPFLRRNRRAILEAVSRQETPFEAVVAALNPERHSTKSPFFQLVVNMIDRSRQESLTLGGLSVTSLAQPEAHAQTELLLELNRTADGLEMHLFYQSDLFAAASMELFLQQLTLLLRQAVDSPDRQLKDFALIDAAQETLLPDPRQELAGAHYTPVHLRFHECARAYPGHPAVEWGTQAWTYAELDSSVRALMGVLQALELPRGAVVAVSAAMPWSRSAWPPWAQAWSSCPSRPACPRVASRRCSNRRRFRARSSWESRRRPGQAVWPHMFDLW